MKNDNITQNDNITELQWQRALALARAHNHGWASWADGYDAAQCAWADAYAAWHASSPGALIPPDSQWEELERILDARVPVPVPPTWEDAALAFEAGGTPGPCGRGVYPWRGHITATGRTSWDVAPDGTVEITISRPLYPLGSCCEARREGEQCDCGVVVLRSTVAPDGTVRAEVLGDAQERHHDALEFCIAALTREA